MDKNILQGEREHILIKVFGPRNPELDSEDQEFYFQTLVDEKFLR